MKYGLIFAIYSLNCVAQAQECTYSEGKCSDLAWEKSVEIGALREELNEVVDDSKLLGSATVDTPLHVASVTQNSKPHILFFLADDLGYHDVGYADDPRRDAVLATPNLNSLRKQGIRLTRHYAHWHCSPSRRSFLSGRWPIHVGGDDLTGFLADDMDMRYTWVSEKLKRAGYSNLFYGKGHIGARSSRMLPINRGFDFHHGFIEGSQSYRSNKRWKNLQPDYDNTFSTRMWGDKMHNRIKRMLEQNTSSPIFLFSSMQAPHSPLSNPPSAIYRKPRSGMNKLDWNMFAADKEIGRTVNLFKTNKQVWDNTLIVFVSDNGGSSREASGNNYPFRGEKGTNFEGGLRVTALVAGGIIPQRLWNTDNDKISHISDWYRTFCNLAGVDAEDDPPRQPKYADATVDDVPDPHYPKLDAGDGTYTNVYGDYSYPKVDSKDLLPVIMQPEQYDVNGVHEYLVLTAEVVLKGHMKLILAQPCSNGILNDKSCKTDAGQGWIQPNGQWEARDQDGYRCSHMYDWRAGETNKQNKPWNWETNKPLQFTPCLFNLTSDKREVSDIQDQGIINDLWADLNRSLLFQYTTHIPEKEEGVTPFYCQGLCYIQSYVLNFFNVDRETPVPRCGLERYNLPSYNYCNYFHPTGGFYVGSPVYSSNSL